MEGVDPDIGMVGSPNVVDEPTDEELLEVGDELVVLFPWLPFDIPRPR